MQVLVPSWTAVSILGVFVFGVIIQSRWSLSNFRRFLGGLQLAAAFWPALLFALARHKNLPQPLVPTASLPGTTRFIFILYKLNLCFIRIDTFQDWGEPDCIQGANPRAGKRLSAFFSESDDSKPRNGHKKTKRVQDTYLKMCSFFLFKKRH